MENPNNLLTCVVCGQAHEASNTCIWLNLAGEGEDRITCKPCCVYIDRCDTCALAKNCDFQSNPSPEPAMIQQAIQVPQGTIIQTIKNPKRVEITCYGCPCWTGEQCGREYNPISKCIVNKWEAGF